MYVGVGLSIIILVGSALLYLAAVMRKKMKSKAKVRAEKLGDIINNKNGIYNRKTFDPIMTGTLDNESQSSQTQTMQAVSPSKHFLFPSNRVNPEIKGEISGEGEATI